MHIELEIRVRVEVPALPEPKPDAKREERPAAKKPRHDNVVHLPKRAA